MSEISLLPATLEFLQRPHGQFIGGNPCTGSGNTIAVINPATEAVIASVSTASTDQINAAVNAAHQCFTSVWADFNPYARGLILNRLADLIEAHGEELAQLETLESGKNIVLSRIFAVQQSALCLRYFAGWTTKISGETLPCNFPSMQGEQYSAYTRREPVGVVAAIVPWNFSVMIACWKLAAALACGCTVVLKPSEFTPLALLRLMELASEAGLPAGALNLVNGAGEVGKALIEHPLVNKVSFTGSVASGEKVNVAAASRMIRCTLELGGKNTAALLKDADINRAVGGLLQTGYIHQGQVCAAPERVLVHRSRIDELTDKLGAALTAAPMGSPLDERMPFGPLSNRPHFDKVRRYLDIAARESRILCGGQSLDRPGYYITPAMVQARHIEETLMQEETFGPVISFMAYDDEEELLGLINHSPYGLGTSLWTNNLAAAMRMIPKVESGTVWVNMHTMVDPSVPFGGVKKSGLGREFGSAAIEEYTELKSVFLCY